MTVIWERFAGRTDVFAIRISFMPDPDAGVAAKHEDSASWGALQIWVGGQNICAHVDQGELLQSAHWYLLPVIEWMADNWNPLLHEEKLPNRNSADTAVQSLDVARHAPQLAGEAETIAWDEERYDWRERHAIRVARSGGLFPNLVIRRTRDLIEFSWNDESVAGTPIGFSLAAASGSCLVEPADVAVPLYEVLHGAANYLAGRCPASQRIVDLIQRLADLRAPRQRGNRLELLAGPRVLAPLTGRLSGASSDAEMRDRWSSVVEALNDAGSPEAAEAALAVNGSDLIIEGSCHATLLFSSVSPTVTARDVQTLAAILVRQYRADSVRARIDEHAEDVPIESEVLPWEQGYDLADGLHEKLALDLAAEWVDIDRVLSDLGVSILVDHLDDPDIRGCCLAGDSFAPTIVRNGNSPYFVNEMAQRFTLAHELCHLLYDRFAGRKVAIASGPWAPRALEQRANAFAAMFLMPTNLVEAAVADTPDPVRDLSGVIRVAETLRVSRRAAIEHLYNLTLMGEAERDELLFELHNIG